MGYYGDYLVAQFNSNFSLVVKRPFCNDVMY